MNMRKGVQAAVVVVVLGIAGWLVRGSPKGADRFPGTYRWELMYGGQEITLEKDGRAHYAINFLDDRDNPRTEVADGRYRVAGDTAYIGLKEMRSPGAPEQPGAEASAHNLVMLLRDDQLVQLNFFAGSAPVFERR
jgi:hypothetical protein